MTVEPDVARNIAMSYYLHRVNYSSYLRQHGYSSDALKAVVAKSIDCKVAATELIELAGAKLHHLFFVFGTYDVVCLIEAPDDTIIQTLECDLGRNGAVPRKFTIKLQTTEEAMSAMTAGDMA